MFLWITVQGTIQCTYFNRRFPVGCFVSQTKRKLCRQTAGPVWCFSVFNSTRARLLFPFIFARSTRATPQIETEASQTYSVPDPDRTCVPTSPPPPPLHLPRSGRHLSPPPPPPPLPPPSAYRTGRSAPRVSVGPEWRSNAAREPLAQPRAPPRALLRGAGARDAALRIRFEDARHPAVGPVHLQRLTERPQQPHRPQHHEQVLVELLDPDLLQRAALGEWVDLHTARQRRRVQHPVGVHGDHVEKLIVHVLDPHVQFDSQLAERF